MAKQMAKRVSNKRNSRKRRGSNAMRGIGSREQKDNLSIRTRLQDAMLLVRKFGGLVLVLSIIGSGLFIAFEAINKPLERVQLNARFERVNTLDVEKVLAKYKQEKFLSIDLDEVQKELENVAWVDRAEVRRNFPASLMVDLSEHVAAARWGESGLLNTRGEVILKNARFLPPELPRLDGPAGSEWQVAQQYLELRKNVLRFGLNIRYLAMDARGAWRFDLSNGMQVRIGREATDQRFYRFSYRVLPLLFKLSQTASVVDMRYSNGFAVQWKETQEQESSDQLGDESANNSKFKSMQKIFESFYVLSQQSQQAMLSMLPIIRTRSGEIHYV